MQSFQFFLSGSEPPEVLFSRWAHQPFSIFLDSARTGHELNRHSILLFDPVERVSASGVSGFAAVRRRLEALAPDNFLTGVPFAGGAAGLFSYDLARSIESIGNRHHETSWPDMQVGVYHQAIIHDHETGKSVYIAIDHDEQSARARFVRVQRVLERPAPACLPPPALHWQSRFSRAAYEQTVQRVIDYIHAGDIFQANLSQRFEADLPPGADPYGHYLHLRKVNGGPFSAFINFGDRQILSVSPERFLTVRDGMVDTRPIKGTRPCLPDPAADEAMRADLLHSAKDRAENVMIVDLLRNDLSKVCAADSVEVPALCALESFPKVHHLVSRVTGRLRDGQDALDLLQACFPGGSITGAPKVRAMQIIEELERGRRGPYCGSMGYIGFDGAMDTNIAIRTLVYENGTASFNVGGGIVADSDPAGEYEETLHKAAGIFQAFSGGKTAQGRKTA